MNGHQVEARTPLSTGLFIQLLGRPRLEIDGVQGYRIRSRKSWAVLAWLLMAERPPTRSQLASLLFSEADDPLGALRWCLAAVQLAMRERRQPAPVVDAASIHAITEAGAAAVSAGAVSAGVASFETAVRLADQAAAESLRVETRLVLAEALIHSVGGLDEEGVARLTEAEQIALANGDAEPAARARAELGYVDFLRARYDRAERWLGQVPEQASVSPSTLAKAMTYLGSVASDRAEYPRATSLLDNATQLSRTALEPRREAFGLSMLGRVNLLRGQHTVAARQLRAAVDLAERDHWLSFLPWPQALLGQVLLSQGDLASAEESLAQSFARACQIGDPCWEGISARGLGLVTEASGDIDHAFKLLLDARSRCNRLADPYVWLDVHILDALCEMGRRHGHPQTGDWVDLMHDRASRTGMRELTVRAMIHGAALGNRGDAAVAAMLAVDIDNPQLAPLLAAIK